MRKTKQENRIQNDAELRARLDEWAALSVERDRAKAELDREVQAVQERFSGKVLALEEAMEQLRAAIDPYVLANQEALCDPGTKSGESNLTVFQVRVGNGTLKTRPKWTWGAILDKLAASPKWGYLVATEQKVRKDQVKLDMDEAELFEYGMRIEKPESVIIKAKTEEL